MAHTPGPWLYREPDGDELHEIYADFSGDLICYPVWTHNQKANIPLIAAAPELLVALKELIDQLEGIGIPDWHGAEGLSLDQARAAINKAEGRGE